MAGVPDRRESYISTQLSSISSQLQVLFDELGLAPQERETRERNLYSVISEALEGHVLEVTQERDALYEKCIDVQSTLQEMLNALKDVDVSYVLADNPSIAYQEIRPPYNKCSSQLDAAYEKIESMYSDRLVRVNQTLETLKDLATKVDGISVANELMLRDEDLDLSNNHIVGLEAEVERWQEEYSRRVSTVAQYASQIVGLWAELGTPQSDIDSNILNCYRSNPEQLGTLNSDVEQIRSRLEGLEAEKQSRIEKLDTLKQQIQHLWEKLSEDELESSTFDKSHRGLTLSVLEAHERELARLNEKKRQHIHVFIQDARDVLRQLWEKLYYSEEETLEFTPAWSDIYTDASLDAHESEIARLQSLVEERKPILTLIDEYYSLQRDAEALEASSQDSSRLLSKGGSGGRRDPGRLLKEEQMRKRIAKKKPKVLQELHTAVSAWETKNSKPFYVNGKDFGQELEQMVPKKGSVLSSHSRGRSRNENENTTGVKQRGGVGSTNKANTGYGHGTARSVSPTKSKTSPFKRPATTMARARPGSPTKSVISTSSAPSNSLEHGHGLKSGPGVDHGFKSAGPPSNNAFKKPAIPTTTGQGGGVGGGGVTRIPSAPVHGKYKSQGDLRQFQPHSKQALSSKATTTTASTSPYRAFSQPAPSSTHKKTQSHESNTGGGNSKPIISRLDTGGSPTKPAQTDTIMAMSVPKSRTISKDPMQIRIPSITGSTTSSSENWEVYDDASSSEDEMVDSNYMKWREAEMRKLASASSESTSPSKEYYNSSHGGHRVSEFNWEKDVF